MTEIVTDSRDGVEAKSGRALPGSLKTYLSILVGCWALSALPLVVRSKHLWSTASLWIQAPFADFGYYYERIRLLHRPEFWMAGGAEWNYPAPCIFVYQLFYAFNRGHGGPHPVHYGFMAYLIFAGVVLAVWGVLLARRMWAGGVSTVAAVAFAATALVLCWPVYVSMERGNIEFFLDAGVVLGLLAYMRRRWWLAAILLGLFGSGKIYPLLFLALFLPLRRWKEFLGGLAAAAGLTIFATRWIGTAPVIDHKTHGVMLGVTSWVMEYGMVFDARLSGVDHSMLGLLKRATHQHPQYSVAVAVGYAVVAAVGMLWLFFGRVWRMPRLNQMLLVGVATVLLPPTSFDYTMTLLLPVWAWMVMMTLDVKLDVKPNDGHAHRVRGALLLALCGFALLFAPEAFITWHGQLLAGQLKAVVLVGLLALSAMVRFEEPGSSLVKEQG